MVFSLKLLQYDAVSYSLVLEAIFCKFPLGVELLFVYGYRFAFPTTTGMEAGQAGRRRLPTSSTISMHATMPKKRQRPKSCG
jgi:hypothetical protein